MRGSQRQRGAVLEQIEEIILAGEDHGQMGLGVSLELELEALESEANRSIDLKEFVPLEQMQLYLAHHLSIAGVKTQLFSPPATTVIQQGSQVCWRTIFSVS
jgi:hypothetical protein